MTNTIAGVQPSVLKWAREQSGRSAEEVGRAFKKDEALVLAWENGQVAPSFAQLEKLAYTIYKRPLAVFFLPSPPAEASVKQEFRTLPDFELDQLSADTRYKIRLARAFQISLGELNNGINPTPQKIFREISLTVSSDIRKAAQKIREFLGVSLTLQSSWRSCEEALKNWRHAIEEAGIFVFKNTFKQKEVSGFCLFDDEFPIIYLNNSTAKTRQIFSLFHELVHLLIKVNAITKVDQSYVDELPPREQLIERFCNALAAELLVPTADFDDQIAHLEVVNDAIIERLANRYWVSRETILRCFLERSLIDQIYYDQKVRQWLKEAESNGSGGNYYLTQNAYLSERYMALVFSKHYQGKLSVEQVADYLGVKTKSVARLEELVLDRTVTA